MAHTKTLARFEKPKSSTRKTIIIKPRKRRKKRSSRDLGTLVGFGVASVLSTFAGNYLYDRYGRPTSRDPVFRLTKYEITRAGQMDGERFANHLVARFNPSSKEEFESLLLPRNVEPVVLNAGEHAKKKGVPSLANRTLVGRELGWYETAFRREFVRELKRMYLLQP